MYCYKWVKFLKLLNKVTHLKSNFFIFNKNFNYYQNFFFKYYNFYPYTNEFFTLKNFSKLSTDKYVLLRFFLLKSPNPLTKIFFILSNIYKIILKKGYFLKIVQLINNILKKLNFFFFDSCFNYHIFNLNIFLDKNNLDKNNLSEFYFFKYSSTSIFDFLIFNNNDLKGEKSFSLEYDNIFTNINYISSDSIFLNENTDYKNFYINNDTYRDYSYDSKLRNKFFLNILFKYFFFFNTNILNSFFFRNNKNLDNLLFKNYFDNLYNINYKMASISMFKNYYMLLFNNLKKLYHENYLNFLNNFFSVDFIISKILSSINFIFKIQIKSLSKKMKKILKNRRRFSIVYTYIKPHRRLNVLLYFIKKYILISDGKDLSEKFYNVLWSLIFENKDSWVSQINKIHQIECATNIKYRLK